MGSKYNIDLTGRVFNKLTVIEGLDEYTNNHGCRGYQKWHCRCSCGKEIITNSFQLLRGTSGSCGISGCGRKYHEDPDLINKKFGHLTVIELLKERSSGQRVWLCLCTCGNLKKATTTKLIRGLCTNCGCSLVIYKDRSIPAKKVVYENYRDRAKLKGLSFNLSFEDFCKLISADCFYCGAPPKNIKKVNMQYRTPGKCVYNGIDRLNNGLGYQRDNCISCCPTCNTAKGSGTIKEFIGYIEKLRATHGQQI